MQRWINDNGRAICPRHAEGGQGGYALQAAVTAAPAGTTEVWTELGSWELFNVKQIPCEACVDAREKAGAR
jgi:hypothetical protein